MVRIWTQGKHFVMLLVGIVIITSLITACGGESRNVAPTSNSSQSAKSTSGGMGASDTGASVGQQKNSSAPGGQQQNTANSIGPQYLIKSLKMSMEVKDTTRAVDDLQTWITTTDTQATSAGINYQRISDGHFNIIINFSVQADKYLTIQQHLRDYAPQQGGRLTSFDESVQNVTNEYVDAQSRLKNLRGEQTRLLELLSHAQALGDILSIEQRLTDVEGQIESIEGRLNALKDQTTFYTISITLQPLSTDATQPTQNNNWNIGQVFHDAFAASLTLAQSLATFLIWLLAFSMYIIPLALIAWFVMRWRTRSQPVATPPSPTQS